MEAVSKKRAPPTEAEIEEARKRKKLEGNVIPEGMSKSAWKKQQKLARWEESKAEYIQMKKDKKKAALQRKKEAVKEQKEAGNYHQAKKRRPVEQKPTGVKIIMDCEFDDLMNDREIVSLSNQITRAYSAQRHCSYDIPLTISSFNKNLKKRFDKAVGNYLHWKNVTLVENDTLKELLPQDLSKHVYLTADTDEVITELEPGHTYIIGGIVDKNRHKRLCANKAKELGLRVGKLPIGKYIDVNGRQVLATSHVYELCCKWFEHDKSWEKAFNDVLPPRKVKGVREKEGEEEKEEKDVEEEKGEKDVEEEEENVDVEGEVEDLSNEEGEEIKG